MTAIRETGEKSRTGDRRLRTHPGSRGENTDGKYKTVFSSGKPGRKHGRETED
jgi:hypothetical protein